MNTAALATLSIVAACCSRSKTVGGDAVDSGPVARSIAQIAEDARSPEAVAKERAEHYRCEKRWEPQEYLAVVEKHVDVNWFCSPWIELETAEPLAIIENDPDPMEEIKGWTLRVGDVRLDVRIDPNWSDFLERGWQKPEIETVVYPELFGRSVRRIMGDRVKRETDLMFANYRRLRVHFSYFDVFDRLPAVDTMIDRAHVPLCDRTPDCE